MQKFLFQSPLLILLVAVSPFAAGYSYGQDTEKTVGQTETKTANVALNEIDDATLSRYASEIEFTKMVMRKTFKGVDLTDEQKAKIFKLIEDHVPQVVVADKATQAVLTAEQKQAMSKQFKSARAAGLMFKAAQSSALRRLKLPVEQRDKYLAAKAASDFQTRQLNNLIVSELTPEQRKSLPMFGGAEPFVKVYMAMRLPAMEAAEDCAFVQSALEGVKGVTEVETNLEKNEVKFYAGYKKKFYAALERLEKDPRFERMELFKIRRLPKETFLPVEWKGSPESDAGKSPASDK